MSNRPITDTAAEGSRFLLQTIVAASAPQPRVRPAPPNPLAIAVSDLIKTLLAMPVPRIPIEPDPGDIQDLNIFMSDYTKAFDALHKAVGEQLSANVSSKVDMGCFTDVFRNATDGEARFEVNRAADIMRDERAEAGR